MAKGGSAGARLAFSMSSRPSTVGSTGNNSAMMATMLVAFKKRGTIFAIDNVNWSYGWNNVIWLLTIDSQNDDWMADSILI